MFASAECSDMELGKKKFGRPIKINVVALTPLFENAVETDLFKTSPTESESGKQ
jgi:hypothetical protein